jgi:glutaminyl-peptide cyclotransferase
MIDYFRCSSGKSWSGPFFALFCFATLLLFCSCSQRNPAFVAKNAPKVDANLAYELAVRNVAIGPRSSGSDGALKSAQWIKEEIDNLGCKGKICEFCARTPEGMVSFRNVLTSISGNSEKFILIGCHYDTKKLATTPNFEGANDGASGVGLLLAMIRAIKQYDSITPLSLKFAFFDGEECFSSYSENYGVFGSRFLAEEWMRDGTLKKCAAVIILDMVGDKDLTITIPAGANDILRKKILKIALKQKSSVHFAEHETDILDDHTPFQDEGVPTIDLIDFKFGPSNFYWHTEADSIDKISAESLGVVGDATLTLIWSIFS